MQIKLVAIFRMKISHYDFFANLVNSQCKITQILRISQIETLKKPTLSYIF